MIILDTNVVSELMRGTPDPMVQAWLDHQPATSIWTTSVTVFELRTGIESLPPSHRRAALEREFQAAIHDDLGGRIQSFDVPAATRSAEIVAARRRAGRPVEVRDVQIAGIALARRATLATRNTRHFEGLGVPLIDPWAVAGTPADP